MRNLIFFAYPAYFIIYIHFFVHLHSPNMLETKLVLALPTPLHRVGITPFVFTFRAYRSRKILKSIDCLCIHIILQPLSHPRHKSRDG